MVPPCAWLLLFVLYFSPRPFRLFLVIFLALLGVSIGAFLRFVFMFWVSFPLRVSPCGRFVVFVLFVSLCCFGKYPAISTPPHGLDILLMFFNYFSSAIWLYRALALLLLRVFVSFLYIS